MKPLAWEYFDVISIVDNSIDHVELLPIYFLQ